MRVLPMGPCAVLVDELADEPAAFAAALRRQLAGVVVDVVPGAATVLVTVDRPAAIDVLTERLADIVIDVADVADGGVVVEIPVVYDGPDLDAVADAAGLAPAEVIEAHAGATYRVDFCGFSPGFGYLSGLPDVLHLPRRATPRTRVPAGAVAIASEYSAVYPSASPGGWHLLGTTTATMFDPRRDQPALLAPGTIVRFTVA